MGNFVIQSQKTTVDYKYTNTANTCIVTGQYSKNVSTGALESYNGQMYRVNQQGQQGEYIGNFNAYYREQQQQLKYNMSEIARKDSDLVWDTIDELEPYVLGVDNNGGED